MDTENEKQIPDGVGDWREPGTDPATEHRVVEIAIEERRYIDLLKTMLAEVIPLNDAIFNSTLRTEVEAEVLKCGMTLPLVRVIPET